MEREFLRYQEISEFCCSDVEELVDFYVDEELPNSLRPKIQAHLLKCSTCRELVDDVVTIVEVARTLSNQALPPGVRDRLREHLSKEVGLQQKPKLYIVK